MHKITGFVNYKLLILLILLFIIGNVSACNSSGHISTYSKTISESQGNNDKLINEFSISTSPGMTLNVKSDVGSVKIKPGSGNEVRVKIYGDDETYGKVEEKAEKTSEGVEITSKIKDEYKNKNDLSLKLRFEIEVPSSYNVKVLTGGGSVSVSDLTGYVTVNTGGGAVTLEGINGNISINTGGGSISITDNSGDLAVNTGGGGVKVTGFDGKVAINTGGGSVSMQGSNGSVDVNTGGGSITLDYSGTNYGVELTTGGGSITIDIPSNFAADVNLNTNVGVISSDFGTPQKNGMGSNLITSINGGGEKLECTTNAGSIRVNYK